VKTASVGLLVLSLSGCASSAVAPTPATPTDTKTPNRPVAIVDAPWRTKTSDAEGHEPPRPDSPPVLIRGARLLVGDGRVIERGFVLLKGGLIAAVGEGDGEAPPGARVIDAAGKVVTPGLIDTHSHLGVYPLLEAQAHSDGNEMTNPVTAGVRTIDGIWPQDPGIERAVAGGVTTIQVLPGSANLIGGRAVTLKLRRAATSREMHFEGAPDGLKMACGENPKRVYGEQKRPPSTRMGNLAGQRAAFLSAKRLIEEWDQFRRAEEKREDERRTRERKAEEKKRVEERRAAACAEGNQAACAAKKDDGADEKGSGEPKTPPKRDLDAETLAGAIEGRILVHVHCYRADDMASILALADEIGFSVRSFHHALEAYKIRGDLAKRGIGVSTWADWWGFKLEAYDGIPENMALTEQAGGRPIIHSDSAEGIRRLNQETAKAMYSGRNAGIAIDDGQAARWMTLNPAWALGIDKRVGSLEVGKDADVVLWSASPFSVYARAELVFLDGMPRWDASATRPRESDFEVQP
jgi:imidazolonepropionase-like amidohydrolase